MNYLINLASKILVGFQGGWYNFMRIAIFVVMAWIGGLKACQYEADGIVPFVANSPLMSFMYEKKAPEYKQYKNPEGAMVAKNIEWHKANGTNRFAYIPRNMVRQDWPYRRSADIWNVHRNVIVPNHDTGGLGAKSGRRLPYTALWLSFPVRSWQAGSERHNNDGRRLARGHRLRQENPCQKC